VPDVVAPKLVKPIAPAVGAVTPEAKDVVKEFLTCADTSMAVTVAGKLVSEPNGPVVESKVTLVTPVIPAAEKSTDAALVLVKATVSILEIVPVVIPVCDVDIDTFRVSLPEPPAIESAPWSVAVVANKEATPLKISAPWPPVNASVVAVVKDKV